MRFYGCILFVVFVQFAGAQPYLQRVKKAVETSKQDTATIRLLLILSREYLIRSGATSKDVDSSVISMKCADALAHRLNYNGGITSSMLMSAAICNFKGEKNKGFLLSTQALQFAIKTNDLQNVGEAYFEIGHHYIDHLDTQLMYYRKAASIFKQTGNKVREGFVTVDIADYLHINGQYQESLQYLLYAVELYKSINYPSMQSVYDLMGVDFVKMNDYTNALKYALMAAKIAESKRYTTLQLCTIYNRISYCYNALSQFQQSDIYGYRALEIAEKFKNFEYIQSVELDLALNFCIRKPLKALFFLKKAENITSGNNSVDLQLLEYGYTNAYIALDKLQNAKAHLEKFILIAAKGNQDRMQQRIDITLARYNLKAKNYERAIQYLAALEKLCITDKCANYMLENQLLWFKADSSAGNYLSSVSHYQRYKFLTDSFYNISKAQLTTDLEVEYNTDKKDKDIQIKSKSIELLTKQSQLDRSKAERITLIRNVTLGGTAMLGLLLAGVFNRYKFQRRNNLLLQHQRVEIDKQNHEINEQYITLQSLTHKQQHLLDEKEWLLKEIHHRVKNNLQTTMSLLNMQSENISNLEALNAIKDSQRRMHTMSLIHQRLYQSDNMTFINMEIYIKELVLYLAESFVNKGNVNMKTSVKAISLDVAFALPLGLIINEAITNIYKYAFPNRRKGHVIVDLSQSEDQYMCLVIEDDGVGFEISDNGRMSSSLGLKLMQGLADQLRGVFVLTSNNGTKISIRFKNDVVSV